MVTISDKISESFSEYLIMTDWIKTKPEDVSLCANLGNIELQYPFITARMQCVSGGKMAVAAGRQGILTMIPRSLRDEDKQKIINANNNARLKKGDIEVVENPVFAFPDSTLGDVIKQVNQTGYSVIPVLDRKSKLYGVYVHDSDNPPAVPQHTQISKLMTFLESKENKKSQTCLVLDSKDIVKHKFKEKGERFLPIINHENILQKLAFLQKFDTNYIGISITARDNWMEELERWGSQVDTMCIDSSNACFQDAKKVLKSAKKRFPEKLFGIGNIIQGKHFKEFAGLGADYIIAGMGVGSICQTGSKRGNGRGQMTVAMELAEARDKFCKETKKYIPLILDGGIRDVKDMTVALAFGDFIMMGNYFNRFIESPAPKFDVYGSPTSKADHIKYIETWGEGSSRAGLVAMYGMNFEDDLYGGNHLKQKGNERYGYSNISSSTIEGVEGTVKCRGRLKPNVEKDSRYIRATISNSGAGNLREFREMAVLERASEQTLKDMMPHDLEVTRIK